MRISVNEKILINAYAWGHISWDKIVDSVGQERASQLREHPTIKSMKL